MINYDILISGISVKNYASNIEVETTIGEELSRSSFRLKKSVKDILNIELQQMVEIYLSGGIVFRGYIDVITEKKAYYEVRCLDVLSSASKKVINRVFLDTEPHGGKISEIFKLLCDEAGLNYDDTTIQDTGDVLKIKKFVCRNASIFERMKKLADAVGYQFYYNPINDKVYFEPFGAREDKGTLTVGQDIPIVKWQKDSRDMFNVLNIIGARQLVETTETFSGDGSTKEFVLGEVPESIKVFVNGNLMKGGVENVSTNPDYVVNKSNKKIIFTTAPENGAEVKVEYSYTIPIPLRIKNEESVATYGKIEKVITLTDVEDLDDAINRATKILDERSKPQLKASSIKVKNFSINPGDKVRIVDNYNGVDKYFIVKSKKQRIPGGFIEITIGDLDWQLAGLQEEMIDRIKKLEELQFQNEDIVSNLVQVGEKSLRIKRKEINVYAESVADSFILGDVVNGKIGIGKVINGSSFASNTSSPYWLEHDFNTNLTGKIWVKVPRLNVGDNSFYVYYGGATNKSNGDDVFEFFDDFDGSDLDPNKWNTATSTTDYTVSNSKITIGDTEDDYDRVVSSNVRYSNNIRLIFYGKFDTTELGYHRQGIYDWGNNKGWCFTAHWENHWSTPNSIDAEIDQNYVATGYDTPYEGKYEIRVKSDKSALFYIDDSLVVDHGTQSAGSDIPIIFTTYDANTYATIDWVAVAKFNEDLSLNITYGPEETGSWTINGETYTKRRLITINSNKAVENYQVILDYSYFNNNNLFIAASLVYTSNTASISIDQSNYIILSYSMKITPNIIGDIEVERTEGLGDLTDYQNGTIGMWVYSDGTTINSVKIQIGNDSNNYVEVSGEVYANEYGYSLNDVGWLYVVFKIPTGTMVGTVDWSNINLFKLVFNVNNTNPFNIDYITISKSSEIGLNGLGERTMFNKLQYSKTY